MAGPKVAGWIMLHGAWEDIGQALTKHATGKLSDSELLFAIGKVEQESWHGARDALQELYERIQRLNQKIDRIEKKIGSV